jgi:hypothetical protein
LHPPPIRKVTRGYSLYWKDHVEIAIVGEGVDVLVPLEDIVDPKTLTDGRIWRGGMDDVPL